MAGNLYAVNTDTPQMVLLFGPADTAREQEEHRSAYEQITGVSEGINRVRNLVRNAADSSSCVLIRAENGLGKEMYARAIHDESDRWNKPYVWVDCSDLPDQDAERFLFGVAGSKNGARGKAGRIEMAAGGTLFLDNIGALPMYLQRRLMRLLEQKEIVRIGSSHPKKVDVRIVAAANRDLA